MEMIEKAVATAIEQERVKLLHIIPRKRQKSTIERILWFLGALAVVVTSIISTSSFTWEYFGERAVHTVVAQDMEKHNAEAAAKMTVVQAQLDEKYAPRQEMERYINDNEKKWARQEPLNEQMLSMLTEVRADIKLLLRRN